MELAGRNEHSTESSDADGSSRNSSQAGVRRDQGESGSRTAETYSAPAHCGDRIGARTAQQVFRQVSTLAIHSDHNLIDSLRAVLRRFEGDTGHDAQSVAELKRILRARIAELEASNALHRSGKPVKPDELRQSD